MEGLETSNKRMMEEMVGAVEGLVREIEELKS